MSNPPLTVPKTPLLGRISFATAIAGILAVAIGSGLAPYKDYTETAQILQQGGWIVVGISILLLAIHHRLDIWRLLQTRQAKYGANSAVLVLTFLGILILINWMAYRHNGRWDLTKNKSFSLSEQTIQILDRLDKDVKVTLFFTPNNNMRQQAVDLLDSYKHYSNNRLTYEAVDPVRNPTMAMRYQITSDGSIIFESGGKQKSIFGVQEQDFTNALLTIVKDSSPKIYFLQGHNELDPDNFDPGKGLSSLKQSLEKDNFKSEKLFLMEKREVPADARVLVVAGPEKPLLAEERNAIQNYLEQRAGKILVLLKPKFQTGIESLLEQYHIQAGNDLIIDPVRNMGQDVAAPAITEYKVHDITKDLKAVSVFPGARSLKLVGTLPAGTTGTELSQTSPQSWAESDLNHLQAIKQDAKDTPGPLSLSVAVSVDRKAAPSKDKDKKEGESKPPQTRLVVVGNTLFASNALSRLLGNSDFFLNSIAWLAQEEDLISIRPKTPEQNQIEMTGEQQKFVSGLTIYGMPSLMLFFGALVWWKRR